MNWIKLSDDEKKAYIKRLQVVCEGLMDIHPHYGNFTKVSVTPSEKTCTVKWNGKDLDDTSGWGMVTREFPLNDIPIVIKRYSDRLRLRTPDEEGA